MNISKRKIELIQAREQISVGELAEHSGISRQNLSTIMLRGTCMATTAGKIAKGLGVDVTEILADE